MKTQIALASHDKLGDTGKDTCLTNNEEEAVELADVVPFLVKTC